MNISHNYIIRLRAINKNGHGPWSDNLQFTSGATCPKAPDSLVIATKSSNCLLINWSEPESNGSPIIEYRLEWTAKENGQFTNLYTGGSLKHELKNLFLPNTKYLFRIQATNIIGPSQYSQIVEYISPASVPGIVTGIRLEEIHTDSALVSWKPPSTNGSPIQFYNIDFNEQSTHSNPYVVLHQNECTYLFDSLEPDTNYKFRIQAANSVGIGQFSNLALAPQPPNLECVWVSYNGIKLKWNSGENFTYILQYRKNDFNNDGDDVDINCDRFATAYEGPSNQFRLNKLSESSSYLFRICAINEAGQGKWSHNYHFSTAKSPPIITKAPAISQISSNGCLVEWNKYGQERPDFLEYCLQIQKKDADFKEVYRGSDCCYRFRDLETNSDISKNVSSNGKASKKSSFSKPIPSELDTDPISTVQSTNDHCWAFLLIIFLVILAFLIAYCVSFYFDVATVRSVEF
ncbi:fibronectin type-III domain-containing [Brachionus plicatilis]|uniref:Fibronectin type-III domain-containing n=1 Tax=Brachionus plicatilis TaxID=10195 RepID=A0A3M7SL97_BRAPC|nr:fibronectin type-III domain-containing [Brachionus plicatilis]